MYCITFFIYLGKKNKKICSSNFTIFPKYSSFLVKTFFTKDVNETNFSEKKTRTFSEFLITNYIIISYNKYIYKHITLCHKLKHNQVGKCYQVQ